MQLEALLLVGLETAICFLYACSGRVLQVTLPLYVLMYTEHVALEQPLERHAEDVCILGCARDLALHRTPWTMPMRHLLCLAMPAPGSHQPASRQPAASR